MTDDSMVKALTTTARQPASAAVAWISLLRPRQWLKNALVAAAPVAAGVRFESEVVWPMITAFAALSLVSSATYCLNDVADAERDRLHPTKRLRPVAAGRVSPGAALAVAFALVVVGFAVSALANSNLLIVLAVYLALTTAYTLGLKHVPVVDIMIVASGFIARAIAGAAAVGVPLSSWFILVTSFGALFVVAGKRFAEVAVLGNDAALHRPALDGYPPAFLQLVLGVSAGLTLISYCLWAFEVPEPGPAELLMTLSIAPFVGAILRYALIVMEGRAGEPEEVFLRDRQLQALGLVWLGLFATGVYGA